MSEKIKIDQSKLINIAIKRAGSIDLLAERLGVCRQTIFKWRNGIHEMKMNKYVELLKMVE